MKYVLAIAIIILVIGLSFLPALGIAWVLTLFTSITLSWKSVLAVWIVITVLEMIFKSKVTVNKK